MYKVDSRVFVLGPYEYVEFKYHLEKDAVMLFSWSADGNVLQDFHGDPDGAPASAAQSYDKQPRRKSDGTASNPRKASFNPQTRASTKKVGTRQARDPLHTRRLGAAIAVARPAVRK